MKRIPLICTSALLALALAGCGGAHTAGQAEYIGLDAAKAVALEDAGVQEASAQFSTAGLDKRNGIDYYDVEFTANGQEYEYDIDAVTGLIIEHSVDGQNVEAAQTPASDPIMRMMDRLPRPFELWRCDEATASRLARITFVDPDKMPLIIAVHPAADGGPTTGVYACSGYNVGSVALAMRLNRPTGRRS